jgi:hypothetical protein
MSGQGRQVMNEMLHHNQPPDMAKTAEEISLEVSLWMSEHPLIQNENEAREAKILIDRGSLGIKDLEDERDSKVRPLNEQVKEINDYYRGPRHLLGRILDELKQRVGQFILVEEAKRQRAAAEAARLAREAEETARRAEQKEREAYSDASSGVLGVDIAARTAEADAAFADYQKAQHQAQIADKDAHVRIGGGYGRALSVRSKDVIIIDDYVKAIHAIGLGNEIIDEAVKKAARAYKKIFGKWPEGIRIEVERSI